jgi:ribosomal protein L37AE/L43A
MEERKKMYCEKCKNTGIVKDKTGVHVCFDCLENDVFEQHGKPKDSGIKW